LNKTCSLIPSKPLSPFCTSILYKLCIIRYFSDIFHADNDVTTLFPIS
jgi:hypothetical protein